MTRAMIAFALLVLVVLALSFAAERAIWPAEPPMLIEAQATQQPALCYPLPTPIDRPKRSLTAKMEDA